MPPPGFKLPLRKPPAHMQAHHNTPIHLPQNFKYFSNLHDALRTHIHSKHRLGKANIETGYYSYYQSLLTTVHKKVSNAFWNMPTLPFKMKRNVFNYRT
eukprot:988304-Pelagomonas_calceolata.AAC.1